MNIIFKIFCIIFFGIPILGLAQDKKENDIRRNLQKLISNSEYKLMEEIQLEDLPKLCDSIIHISKILVDENSRIYGLFLKGSAYIGLKKYSEAIECFETEKQIKKENISAFLENYRNYSLGIIKFRQNDLRQSIAYLKLAEDYFLKDTVGDRNFVILAIIYKFKGRIYAENGVYSQAIEMYEKSIKYLKKTPFQSKIYELYRFIGRAYFHNRQFDQNFTKEALRNYLKALDGFKRYQIIDEMPWMYTNLSDFYLKNGNLKLAKIYQDSCMLLANKFNLTELIAISYNNYGEINFLNFKLNEAATNFKLAIEYYKKSDNTGNQIVSLNNLSGAYNQLKLYDSAEKYSSIALALALKIRNNDKIANSYKTLADVSFNINNFKEAYLYFTKYKAFNDSVYQKQNMDIAYTIREIHENEVNEKENLILKNENQKKAFQIKLANKRLILGIIVFIVLILSVVFSFYNMKRKKEMQSQIEKQLLITEKFNIKEKTLKETERELHCLTNEIIGVAKSIRTKDLQTNLSSEIEVLELIDKKMRNIQSLLKAPNEIANFRIKLDSLLYQQKKLYTFKVVSNIDSAINWDTVCPVVQTHLYRILQLLLQNTNNHANATEVGINCYIAENKLNFMYNDDGIGYNPEKSPKDRGLAEISSRLSSVNGHIVDESKEQVGCEISIEIPIS